MNESRRLTGRRGDLPPAAPGRGFRLEDRLAATAGLALALASAPVLAGESAGRDQARVCATCHGPHGMATAPNTPNLAGQPAGYLSAQLKAFRSGSRRSEVMNVVAKSLSDAEIEDLAAWFASVRVSATPPE